VIEVEMIFMGPIEVIPLSLPLNDKNIDIKLDGCSGKDPSKK